VDAVIVSDYNYGVADAEMPRLQETWQQRGRYLCWLTRVFDFQVLPPSLRRPRMKTKLNNYSENQIADVAELESAAEELREQLGYRAVA